MPEEPFTQGRPYSDFGKQQISNPDDRRGEHPSGRRQRQQIDLPRLRLCFERQARATATSMALIGQMNNKTRAVCENAKAAGITVYTIAFRLENDANTRRPAGELRLECGGRPTRRATEPPWCRPSRRLRAKSRNCESPVETRQGRPFFPAARACAHLIGREPTARAAARRGRWPASQRGCQATAWAPAPPRRRGFLSLPGPGGRSAPRTAARKRGAQSWAEAVDRLGTGVEDARGR